MSLVVELLRSRRVPQAAALALISLAFAGCSADTSTRFQASNFSNPFASQPEATASVPTAAVERRELPQYSRPHAPLPSVAAPQSHPATPSSGMSGGGRGLSSYQPPQRPQLETTGSVGPKSVAATRNAPAHGGATIIVGTSDTLEIIAKRYNVSSAEILKANGYKGPRALSPGQQLIIPPRQSATAAAMPAPAVAAPASKPVAAASTMHVVNKGDTLHSIARRNHVPVGELARANNLDQSAKLSIGMKLTVPGSKSAAAEAAAAAPAQQVAALSPPATRSIAPVASQQQSARLAQSNTLVEEKPVEPAANAKPSETTSALPSFRWPVRGKVITGYGAKTNGKSNDGINVAVPEGTPVKASEDGVVAYSGNELKGYGNLILVRHSNGYVTAYAHASELLVKRGDTIKRGQIIAKSGQSGEVGSPQLHFEIRKGSSPVDPLQFLNGA
jgi:murein DD-endopeptidase MepM/ murein hydrolase activator NlpD